MTDVNRVNIIGRLTRDITVNKSDKGNKVATLSLAIPRSFKNSDGIYETDFIRCVLWNNVALNTFSYCRTGDVVGIKGRLQTRSYEDDNKEKKYIMEVIAEKVTFLSSNKNEQSSND